MWEAQEMKKVLVVAYMHKKYDKRVWKSVEILSKIYDVIYIYWDLQNEKPYKYSNIEYIPVYYKYETKSRFRDSLKRIRYERKICQISKKYINSGNIDIVYIHHFATFFPFCVYKLAKKRKIPIVTDYHEYIPEEYMFSLRNKIPFIEIVGKAINKKITIMSSGGIFVSPWVKKVSTSINPSLKAIVIPNYALMKTDVVDKNSRSKEIIFVGGMLKKMDYEFKILEMLRKEGFKITSLGVNFKKANVNYERFLPYDKMMKRISTAAFSLISYSPYDTKGTLLMNYSHSFPNKFFDSIAAGVPVIVRKEFKEMVDIVEKYGVGIVIPSDDEREAANMILKAWNEHYDLITDNIKKYQDEFCWNEDKEKLFLDFFENIRMGDNQRRASGS